MSQNQFAFRLYASQKEKLRKLSHQQNKSIAQLIRDAIDLLLEKNGK